MIPSFGTEDAGGVSRRDTKAGFACRAVSRPEDRRAPGPWAQEFFRAAAYNEEGEKMKGDKRMKREILALSLMRRPALIAFLFIAASAQAELVVTFETPENPPASEQGLARALAQAAVLLDEFKQERELVTFYLRSDDGQAMLTLKYSDGAQYGSLDHDVEKALADPEHRVTIRLDLKAADGPDAYGHLHAIAFEIARGDLDRKGGYAYEALGGSFAQEACEDLRRALLKASNAHARIETARCAPTGSKIGNPLRGLGGYWPLPIADEYALSLKVRLAAAGKAGAAAKNALERLPDEERLARMGEAVVGAQVRYRALDLKDRTQARPRLEGLLADYAGLQMRLLKKQGE